MTLFGWHEDSEGDGLRHVLAGAYDVPGLEFERPPRIIDCGANIGCFALWAAKRWPGCTILALEPNPRTFAALCANVASVPGVVPLGAGAFSTTTRLPLFEGVDDKGREAPACSGVMQLSPRQQFRHVEAHVIYSGLLPPCEILKVDTEGSEMPILLNYPFLWNVAACMVEHHSGAGLTNEREKIAEVLTRAGLALVRENPGTGEMVWRR